MAEAEPRGLAKPHVVKIAPTPFFADRGCHVRILEEVRALEARGFRVTVCTYHLGRDPDGVAVKRSWRVPWYRKLSAGPSIHKLYIDLLLAWTVIRVCGRDRPDIIHAHLHEGIVVGWLPSLLFRVPLIADLQGSLTGELLQHRFFRRGGWLHRLFRAVERLTLRMPSAFLLSSPQATAEFGQGLEGLPAPAFVLTDGVDVDTFFPVRPGENLRHKLSLPREPKIVGYLGVLDDYQGVSVLLEAARLVTQEMDGVRFLVMGYPNVERYRQRAVELGIADRVILPGRIAYDSARDYLAACDVGVSAKQAVTEANGKLLNYMAVGIPIVVTDTPVNRDLLGDLGVYAPVDDPPRLARALLEVLADEKLARDLGERLRRKAVEEVSWNVKGDQIVEAYRSLHVPSGERSGRARVHDRKL